MSLKSEKSTFVSISSYHHTIILTSLTPFSSSSTLGVHPFSHLTQSSSHVLTLTFTVDCELGSSATLTPSLSFQESSFHNLLFPSSHIRSHHRLISPRLSCPGEPSVVPRVSIDVPRRCVFAFLFISIVDLFGCAGSLVCASAGDYLGRGGGVRFCHDVMYVCECDGESDRDGECGCGGRSGGGIVRESR